MLSVNHPHVDNPADPLHQSKPPGRGRLLITAGPTWEPIDSVRYIGNRSSGRLGTALANEAARRGWQVHILFGPSCLPHPPDPIKTTRFQTTADLQLHLSTMASDHDIIIMAAAVADFRIKDSSNRPASGHKIRRTSGLTLDLEPTPDLLSELAARRRPGQLLVGFALEPRESLVVTGLDKLQRKGADLIVANPLETMDSDQIEAVVLGHDGFEVRTAGKMNKPSFAAWLLDLIEARHIEARQEKQEG